MAKSSKFSRKLEKLAAKQDCTVKRVIIDGKPVNYISQGMTGGHITSGIKKIVLAMDEITKIIKNKNK